MEAAAQGAEATGLEALKTLPQASHPLAALGPDVTSHNCSNSMGLMGGHWIFGWASNTTISSLVVAV